MVFNFISFRQEHDVKFLKKMREQRFLHKVEEGHAGTESEFKISGLRLLTSVRHLGKRVRRHIFVSVDFLKQILLTKFIFHMHCFLLV